MNVHKNARLTAHSRAERVRRVLPEPQSRKAVAASFGVDPKTVAKWVERFQTQGATGLSDRSSRPGQLRQPTSPETQDRIVALRRQRLTGQHIARKAGVSPATVSRVLRRAGSVTKAVWILLA
jgi:transposase